MDFKTTFQLPDGSWCLIPTDLAMKITGILGNPQKKKLLDKLVKSAKKFHMENN